MEKTASVPLAVVGLGAVLPDARNVAAFWDNVQRARSSITEVSPDRWDPAYYYDPDPRAPDKTYSKIGGWVRDAEWEPVKWRLPIPPRVSDAMDGAQRWAIACTVQALNDYGYPARPLDLERTAVILGNAMGGEQHYRTTLRISFPEYAARLTGTMSFDRLPEAQRTAILDEAHRAFERTFPEITEDSMPGELSNCIAGRLANLFNFRGPNFVCDAACASAMAAVSAAAKGLAQGEFDIAVTGGVDRNMGASSFIKFSKIGALSATGSRPYAEGADGFVMGEGCVLFVLKRLADAERAGDKIYAVLLGVGASSDGKGKGITAPNPIGQRLAISRAWENAGVSLATVGLVEGHGTSTAVGDVVEVESLGHVLGSAGLKPASVALGSVKSNIGHLKAAAGAAGLLKTILALHAKVLPPSINFTEPNHNIDFKLSPFYVNTEPREWKRANGAPRRACASAFGFGGTNFHCVLEEYEAGREKRTTQVTVSIPEPRSNARAASAATAAPIAVPREQTPAEEPAQKAPLRGALVIGAATPADLRDRLVAVQREAAAGRAAAWAPPAAADLGAPERLAIDYGTPAELADRAGRALNALDGGNHGAWKLLRSQGIFRGSGPRPKVAFLYPGQGSQYVNMLRPLRDREPIVAATFAEADRISAPLLGKPLTDFLFVDSSDGAALERAENALKQTAITQPAVLTVDLALTRLLEAYGVVPDMVMGHSLGEYGALQAAGALPFADAVEAVSARGSEMTRVAVADTGKMAAVFAPIDDIERILKQVDGYVVIANVNSRKQAVIGGASAAVERAIPLFQQAGYTAIPLPVSHAFHTSIVAPASEPLRAQLRRLRLAPPKLPVIANVTGDFYPNDGHVVAKMVDILGEQVAAPVQFVKGLNTLYAAGVRVFVEVGPKKALHGFADEAFGELPDVLTLFTNHPKSDDAVAFNQALCGLYAAGLGKARAREVADAAVRITTAPAVHTDPDKRPTAEAASPKEGAAAAALPITEVGVTETNHDRREAARTLEGQRVVVTGAALGLPGTAKVFDDENVGRMLRGTELIDVVPVRTRRAMVDKHITRLVKTEDGSPRFEVIDNPADVVKLAARAGALDLTGEFGVPAERVGAFDSTTQLAIAAGLEALRDAGIPLVLHYRTTSKGTKLPNRWGLPEALRDETGVIFASAFPGYDAFASEMTRYHLDRARRHQLHELEAIRARMNESPAPQREDVDRRIAELREDIDRNPYIFDRRFLMRVLPMAHSQFAELVGARGPNMQINAACASTTQAVALAEDWIKLGRCRRVLVISADNVTSENLLEWMGSGFLASGAAATDEVVEEAALPFDRRRHGLIVGMGAAAIVVESLAAAQERGLQPICEVLASIAANSAYHGTRLNVDHICDVMESLVRDAETRWGIDRRAIAPHTVFVSHETYTPARGGSASAEVYALRRVFGEKAADIVVANTKGYTGHPMGAGIEDVTAIKALETGLVPPVANFKEVDPELGPLNLSKGGVYPIQYALRLAAGFGSQISMSLLRWTPTPTGERRRPHGLGFDYRVADRDRWKNWLAAVSGQSAPELEVVQRTLRIRDSSRPAVGANTPAAAVAGTPARPGAPFPAPAVAPAIPTALSAPAIAAVTTPAASAGRAPIDGVTTPVARGIAAAPVVPIVQPRATVVAPTTVASSGPADLGPSGPAGADAVRETIVALVVEKTGYPADMLDLDLDLEADLGVDTVKQAELLAAIRGIYNIRRDESLKLRDFPTLNHVIKFVLDKRRDLAAATAPAPVSDRTTAAAAPAEPSPTGPAATPVEPQVAAAPVAAQVVVTAPSALAGADAVRDTIIGLVVEKTGYPADMLDLDLDLEADLGVDTVKQAELLAAIRGIYSIPRDESLKLRDFPTLKHVIKFVLDKRPDLVAASAPVPVSDGTAAAAAPAEPSPSSVATPVASPVVPAPVASQVATAPVAPIAHDTAPAPAAGEPGGSGLAAADAVRDTIIGLVVEKTGYPADMLDLDLDLEADLGVDTVKQAELLAAIRGIYRIPRDESLKLRDFPTLRHVIRFVLDRRPDLTPTPPAAPPGIDRTPAPSESIDAVRPGAVAPAPALLSFEAADSVPRRVPVPAFRPEARLCKPTGVVLGPGKRVVVAADHGGVATAVAARLAELGVATLALDTQLDADALTAQLMTWVSAGAVDGLFWLPALDCEGDLRTLTPETWHKALHVRVELLYETARALYDQFGVPGRFLVAGTRLGGQHGYDANGAYAPLGGAVTGFLKAFHRERADALIKAVDFAPDATAAFIADRLIQETLRDPAIVEAGYKDDLRWTVGLAEVPAAAEESGIRLSRDTVFVITGAAGSIVSAITADLAAASGGRFYLLDRVPEPDPADADIPRLAADKDALKRDIAERMKARGEKATPALVDRELAALERAEALLSAIQSISKAGGVARYLQTDLTDAEAVGRAMDVVRREAGRIDVLVHAAGIDTSHLLPDKRPGEFALVFGVKSDGWFNLLHSIGDMPIAATVVFSSIAARFGNMGQTDYAAANDLLCKMTSSFRRTRPGTRAIAIDWTAWRDIGMASRGSIPTMMAQVGIDMLPPAAGVPIVRRELTRGTDMGEVVIALGVGGLLREGDPDGGIDCHAIVAAQTVRPGPMIGSVIGMAGNVLTVETTLDPAEQPFLKDHQIEGTPVLPGVMGIEAFAEIAALAVPGWEVAAVEDVTFASPFKFYRGQPRTLKLEARFRADGADLVADCRLLGERLLPGQSTPQETEHFTGRVRLMRAPVDLGAASVPKPTDVAIGANDIYRIYFHGPAYRVLGRVFRTDHGPVGEVATALPANHVPGDRPTIMAPRLIESCFQAAGIWELETSGRMALPFKLGGVSASRLVDAPVEPLHAVVRPGATAGTFDAAVVDATGCVLVGVRGYGTTEVPDAVDKNLLRDALAHFEVAVAG